MPRGAKDQLNISPLKRKAADPCSNEDSADAWAGWCKDREQSPHYNSHPRPRAQAYTHRPARPLTACPGAGRINRYKGPTRGTQGLMVSKSGENHSVFPPQPPAKAGSRRRTHRRSHVSKRWRSERKREGGASARMRDSWPQELQSPHG